MNFADQMAKMLSHLDQLAEKQKKKAEGDLTALIALVRTEEKNRALNIIRQCANGVGKQFEAAEAHARN